VQLLVGFLNGTDTGNSSVTHALNATATPQPQFQPSHLTFASFPSLISLLLAFPGLRDWLKLIIIGSVLETCRRFYSSIWSSVVNSFFITAQFKEEDSSYDWIMVWLSKQPAWSAFPARS
jgi:mitochondrial chaperone BCS1